MSDRGEGFIVGVVQAAPVAFDAEATLARIESYLAEAAERGARLVLFPEAFLPGYPRGSSFGTVVGHRSEAGRQAWEAYWRASVEVPGPISRRLGELARRHRLYLAIGLSERAGRHSLYCSLLTFDPRGILIACHRKIKPTGAERLIWSDGPGDDLRVADTPMGGLGGLICWENYMPLARMTLYRQNVAIYLAPTADARSSWQGTLQHIACEGRCLVLSANQVVGPDDVPAAWPPSPGAPASCRGGSAIVDPYGNYLAGPLYDEAGLLLATFDPKEIVRARFDFDVDGHYQRPDLFDFAYRSRPDPVEKRGTHDA